MPEAVLVTGAGGYLGSKVVAALRDRGHHVIAATRRPLEVPVPGVTPLHCDLAEANTLLDHLKRLRPRQIVHCAAWIGAGNSALELEHSWRDNVRATASLIAAARTAPPQRFVFCSSAEVYAECPENGVLHRESDAPAPNNSYGRSKLAAEALVRLLADYGTETLAFRMPGIHGRPRSSGVIARWISSASSVGPLRVPEPDTQLSFLWIDDAVEAIIETIDAPGHLDSPTVNLASFGGTLGSVAAAIRASVNPDVPIEFGAGPKRNRQIDTSLLARNFKIRMTGLEAGLRREIAT